MSLLDQFRRPDRTGPQAAPRELDVVTVGIVPPVSLIKESSEETLLDRDIEEEVA